MMMMKSKFISRKKAVAEANDTNRQKYNHRVHRVHRVHIDSYVCIFDESSPATNSMTGTETSNTICVSVCVNIYSQFGWGATTTTAATTTATEKTES